MDQNPCFETNEAITCLLNLGNDNLSPLGFSVSVY